MPSDRAVKDGSGEPVSETVAFDCPKCGPQEYLVCLSESLNKKERETLVYIFKTFHRKRRHAE